jgi:hypothetical protein
LKGAMWMQEENSTHPVQQTCQSVFKSGESTTTKNQFTRKWIELINQLEKNKRIAGENRY